MPAPSTLAFAPCYDRHRPARTALYAVIAEHYPSFVREIERSVGHPPKFVRQDFKGHLKCGLLEHGFLLANDPQALTAVLAVLQRGISTF